MPNDEPIRAEDHMGLVWKAVSRMTQGYQHMWSPQDIEDFKGEGMIGLVKAAKKYRPGPVEFSTYATWWIMGCVSNEKLRKKKHPYGWSRVEIVNDRREQKPGRVRECDIDDPAAYRADQGMLDIQGVYDDAGLTEQARQIVNGYVFIGMKDREIADILGVSRSRVSFVYKNARIKMAAVGGPLFTRPDGGVVEAKQHERKGVDNG